MLTDTQRDQLKQALRPMQIIVAALAGGVISFFVAVMFIAPPRAGNAPENNTLLTYIGVGAAVVGLVAWAVLPNLVSRQFRNSVIASDARRLAAVYQTRLIIGCALVEGIAFFNLVAYLIEHQRTSLVVAGIFLLILLSQIPTLDRLERWIESELAVVEQLRELEPPRGR